MLIRSIRNQAQFREGKMGKVDLAMSTHLFAGLNAFEPGQEHAAHVHADQDKMYLVLQGKGVATVGDERYEVSEGDLVLAGAGIAHSMKNEGPERLVVMVVFAPAH